MLAVRDESRQFFVLDFKSKNWDQTNHLLKFSSVSLSVPQAIITRSFVVQRTNFAVRISESDIEV